MGGPARARSVFGLSLRGWRMRLLLSWTVFRPYPFWGPEPYLRAAGALKNERRANEGPAGVVDGRRRALPGRPLAAGPRFALFGDTGRVPTGSSVGSCCPLQGVVGTIMRRLQGRVTELGATSLSYS